MNCTICNDTGKRILSNGQHSDYVDCSCQAATERAELDVAVTVFVQSYEGDLQHAPEDVRWFVHQRAVKMQAARVAGLDALLLESRANDRAAMAHLAEAKARIAELESRIEFNGDHSQDGIVKRDERIADLERQLRNAKFAENLDAEDKAFFASLRAPSAPAVEQPIQWTYGPNVWKDWCTQYFGPDADDTYLAEAVFNLPPMAQKFKDPAAPQAADTDKVREFVEAVATNYSGTDNQERLYCYGCEADLDDNEPHKSDCIVLRAQAMLPSMAAQAPVREVPEVNDAKYSEAEKAVGKIIFQRYPRIKGVHCASITIGVLEYMGLRHSALNYNDQEQQDE